jgi:predicted unusual protein kinase regulating ubiquinone biosynthesis (AarF/ABC1/UbiB family)
MTMLSKKKSGRKAAFVRATTQGRVPAISNPQDVVRDVVKSMDDIEDETGEKISNLEAVVLDYSLGYTEKLLKINQFFKSNPLELAARCGEVIAQFSSVLAIWKYEDAMDIPLEKRTRAGKLRDVVAKLGPVFVKLAQTLSTRPDIIGEEAADALMTLQQDVKQFDSEVAFQTIREELINRGSLRFIKDIVGGDPETSLYSEFKEKPIAAASIGQVYEARLHDAQKTKVAVKVQRPGMVRRIALDCTVIRLLLTWLEESGANGSEDLPFIIDEVGAGIFRELDYTLEARNAKAFKRSLKFLPYVKIPRSWDNLTSTRVLTQEFISGRPMKKLNLDEQRKMVRMGVECSSAQLFRTGLVHADPHEGNMLYTDQGQLALIDFGLICEVNNAQQEAMASCILNILNAQWDDLIDNLRIMGMLPDKAQIWKDENGNVADYTSDPGKWYVITDDEFRRAFREAMDGPDGMEKKQRNNFTELVVDLTKISTQYRFNLPPYMVFVIRSLTTLDFCAVRTGANMYEVAAPTALFRALSPRTAYGKQVLERTIMDKETGDIDWQKFLDLSRQASGNSASSTASESERSDAQDSVEKLGGELLNSSAGSSLRSIIYKASPKNLTPPKEIQKQLIQLAIQHYAKVIAEFSIRTAVSNAFAFLTKANGMSQGENNEADEECEINFDDPDLILDCKTQLAKRRQKIGLMLLRKQLFQSGGLWTFTKIFLALIWAFTNGVFLGLIRKFFSSSNSSSPNSSSSSSEENRGEDSSLTTTATVATTPA